MQRMVIGLVGVYFIALCGCGAAELPYTDNSRDSEAYAKNIKQLVVDMSQSNRGSPEIADSISSLVEELKQTDRPQGEHAAKYAEIRAVAEAIVAEGNPASGKPTATQIQKLDELAKLAQDLPGEVTVSRPEND